MNIFGIGFPELLLIFVIALIVLGPRNMVSTSKQLSAAIRKFISSNTWKSIINSTQEIRDIQDKIIKDTGLSETFKTLQDSTRDLVLPSPPKWNSKPNTSISSPMEAGNNPTTTHLTVKPDVINNGIDGQSSIEETSE